MTTAQAANPDTLLRPADPAGQTPRPLSERLPQHSDADSLAGGDSLLMAQPAADSLAAASELYRRAAVREVFGGTTVVVAPSPTFYKEPPRPLTGNPVFEGLVLLLAAVYAMLLYRHKSDVLLLFYRISHDRASSERLMEDPGGHTLTRFLKISAAIGLLFIGVAVTRIAETFFADVALPPLPYHAEMAAALLFAAIWMTIALYQTVVLKTVTTVTLTRPFMTQLRLLKRTYFALAVVAATPPLLLLALCPPRTGMLWLGIVLLESAVTAVLYIRETLHLFIAKKIPILHWFLYLCAVEIFPFSLLWLIAVR
ncbi:MAG: DUF4271 domain-containing protein [Alistipes sp.]|nr:DUF4271 domain-containing protein [Alistipes sp.]